MKPIVIIACFFAVTLTHSAFAESTITPQSKILDVEQLQYIGELKKEASRLRSVIYDFVLNDLVILKERMAKLQSVNETLKYSKQAKSELQSIKAELENTEMLYFFLKKEGYRKDEKFKMPSEPTVTKPTELQVTNAKDVFRKVSQHYMSAHPLHQSKLLKYQIALLELHIFEEENRK